MMAAGKQTITCAGRSIAFRVHYSRRKTMEIAVHPDGSVVVRAPLGTDQSLVENRVHKRAHWINRHLRHFAQFQMRTPKRQYVGGESHLYLGKKYRLKITRSDTKGVLLKHGYLHVTAPDPGPENVAKLLDAWYRRRARIYFAQALEKCWHKYHFQNKGVEKPILKIRAMKTRWGSLSKRGGMTLNLELVKTPGECIEYVIVHELCHLFHLNHGKEFYKLLAGLLPDWKNQKQKLEMALI